ncbi:reverse transcriptase [Tanacetum coccineum]|uniref:Reverse transcriptase n=1 Tax=Tanacetum coccineum TaxID=301880 RepID=A0ABQ5AL75_9ASTR
MPFAEEFLKDGKWNIRMLRECISATEAELISQILISQTSSPDKLIWHFDSKGRYTVKSGYKQALALVNRPVATTALFLIMYASAATANLDSCSLTSPWWIPPHGCSVKLNCDAAFKDSKAAFDIVVRDSTGCLCYVLGNCCHAISPTHAEIIAVHSACSLAFNRGWLNAIMESNSQVAISLSFLDSPPPWCLAALVDDIRLWSSSMQLSFLWVNRERNQAADWFPVTRFQTL